MRYDPGGRQGKEWGRSQEDGRNRRRRRKHVYEVGTPMRGRGKNRSE